MRNTKQIADQITGDEQICYSWLKKNLKIKKSRKIFIQEKYRNRLIKTPGIKLLKFSFIPGFGFIPYLIKVHEFSTLSFSISGNLDKAVSDVTLDLRLLNETSVNVKKTTSLTLIFMFLNMFYDIIFKFQRFFILESNNKFAITEKGIFFSSLKNEHSLETFKK
ncbi:hypothetical protein BpHYR1_036711 [Brachionus plicatilis]|uniref:Uncharacterized protein n=1 Tax=Brachionus plicatilis TaxID=10195 RepID=A0A3M7QXM2_BRAPC|nr:hypothetical protein BpHYR1_036711 [Brachionus plicatilis]